MMKETESYSTYIIHHGDALRVQKYTSDYLKSGWRLAGGLIVTGKDTTLETSDGRYISVVEYAQAMVI